MAIQIKKTCVPNAFRRPYFLTFSTRESQCVLTSNTSIENKVEEMLGKRKPITQAIDNPLIKKSTVSTACLKEEKKSALLKKKKSCSFCSIKVGIYGYTCRCNNLFCTKHRLPETHSCTYDHGELDKERLREKHSQVIASKLWQL